MLVSDLFDVGQESQYDEAGGRPAPDATATAPAPAPVIPSRDPAAAVSYSFPLTVVRAGKPVEGLVVIVPAIGDEMIGFTDAKGTITVPLPEGARSVASLPIIVVNEIGERIEANVAVSKPGEPRTIEIPVAATVAKASMVAPMVLVVGLLAIFVGNYLYKKY
jgi:hypothetical protein